MEFWGVEVKPGQTLKCEIEEGKLLHLSQAALGESKNKGLENVPIFVKFNDQKLVVGTLSQEKCAQIQYDLVFEKEFELSHSSKNVSVYFCGYKTVAQDEYPSGDDYFDSESEEDLQIAANTNGKVKAKDQDKPAAGKTNAGKEDNSAVKAKAKAKKEEAVKADAPKLNDEDDSEDESDDDEDDSEDESDDDEDMLEPVGDSDDEDDEDESSGDDDESTPKKAAVSVKKRPAEPASKTPAEKKAKVIPPAGQKTGDKGKKGSHTATPHPAKQAGRTPANNDKSKQQNLKSAGSVTCKPCNKSFNSDNALQAHNKAKHSAAK